MGDGLNTAERAWSGVAGADGKKPVDKEVRRWLG